MSGLMRTCVPPIRIVWPSGAARATTSVPMMLLPPGFTSTTTGWVSYSESPCCTARATMSTVPPGGFGTTICTGFHGKLCAAAEPAKAKAAISVVSRFIRISLVCSQALAKRVRDTIRRAGKPLVTGSHMSRIGNRGEMEAFLRSVELGSFSQAARELKLTPSALSKLVTRLEKNLKVRLLTRTTRRLAPTLEGELFAARCRRILAEMEDAETEIGRSRERPRGRLRMHAGVGIAMHQIVDVLPRFFERYPEVDIDLLIEDRRVDLVRENIDISVRPWQPETSNLVVRKIFEFERVLCASPAYLKRHGRPKTPEELSRHRIMGVSSIPLPGQWLLKGPDGPRMFDVQLHAAANNADAIYRFALSGLGIARLNEFVVAAALRAGTLVTVLDDFHVDEKLAMLAIYPHERHRLPRVAAMLDFLTETFGPRPWRSTAAKAAKSR